MKAIDVEHAWAWEIEVQGRWMLCQWAEPTSGALQDRPSSEARKVRVTIVRSTDYQRLIRGGVK